MENFDIYFLFDKNTMSQSRSTSHCVPVTKAFKKFSLGNALEPLTMTMKNPILIIYFLATLGHKCKMAPNKLLQTHSHSGSCHGEPNQITVPAGHVIGGVKMYEYPNCLH